MLKQQLTRVFCAHLLGTRRVSIGAPNEKGAAVLKIRAEHGQIQIVPGSNIWHAQAKCKAHVGEQQVVKMRLVRGHEHDCHVVAGVLQVSKCLEPLAMMNTQTFQRGPKGTRERERKHSQRQWTKTSAHRVEQCACLGFLVRWRRANGSLGCAALRKCGVANRLVRTHI